MICVDTTFLIDLWRDKALPSSPARNLLATHAGEEFAARAHAAGEFLEGGAAVSERRLTGSLQFLRLFRIGEIRVETALRYAKIVATLRLCVAGAVLVALLLATGALARSPLPAPPRDAAPGEVFFDELTVHELTVILRVLDSFGAPVPGLEAGDLVVRVGGEEVPVADLTWHSSDPSTSVPRQEPRPPSSAEPEVSAPAGRAPPAEASGPMAEGDGQLVVLFVQMGHAEQVTLDESWVGGYMKILPSLRRLVASLAPRDRVAVVSYDSRLKLRQDFSRDREATAEQLGESLGFGDAPRPSELEKSPGGPSLSESWDFETARKTTSPEEGLRVLGEALAPLPGPKEVIFVGWGLGRYTAGFVTMPPVYRDAVRSLLRARATVHGLNVIQADGNALAAGVRGLAETTGGTYAATFHFGRTRVEELGRALTGHYLLTLVPSDFPEARGRLEVRLRQKIEGRRDVRVHHRELRVVD